MSTADMAFYFSRSGSWPLDAQSSYHGNLSVSGLFKAVFPASVWGSQRNMFKIRFLAAAFPAQLAGEGMESTVRSFPTLERQVICAQNSNIGAGEMAM